MRITTVVAPLLGANAYVLEDDEGRCVVVDPGAGVVEELAARLQDSGLRPLAVLLTHGHVDHTWSAGPLSRLWEVPVLVHAADAYRLADPFGTLGPLGPQLEQMAAAGGMVHTPPADVVTFTDRLPALGAEVPGRPGVPGDTGTGFPLEARHAPGHTEGSTVYLFDGAAALTGDVLFAGTIGRTDLPGGDPEAMAGTLRDLAALDPAMRVLPGHGPASTLGEELATNPYLRTV